MKLNQARSLGSGFFGFQLKSLELLPWLLKNRKILKFIFLPTKNQEPRTKNQEPTTDTSHLSLI